MSDGAPVSRRAALRGAGVVLTLPWLEAMVGGAAGGRALGGVPGFVAGSSGGAGGAAAVTPRLGFVFIPNGVNYDAWAPVAGGGGGGLGASATLKPLADAGVARHVNVVTGLTLHTARANGDGPGDHARSSAAFLTGHQARKTAGNDIKAGVSVDQVAAKVVGKGTRLPSLELGCEQSPSAGNCDSGYSCAYTSNISWRSEDVPMPKQVDPAAVFERLFGGEGGPLAAAAAAERMTRRKSILDFVREDARRLEGRLGAGDKRKLEQYQVAVREVEERIERSRAAAKAEGSRVVKSQMAVPAGVPRRFGEHVDLMYDLMHLAFSTDSTRVATFMLGVDGSNRAFPELSIKEGHHHLSHHQNNAEMIEKIRAIDKFYVERFARFVKKMSETAEGSGTLLDSCMLVYGGGISDGNKHNHEDLPIVLAGGKGVGIGGGRVIKTAKETPLCDLYVSLLARMGCGEVSFGDSRGAVEL